MVYPTSIELRHQLKACVDPLAWPQVTLIFMVILATVVVSEWISARLRHAPI
ncbi:hypothetical protein [uncultured Thiohalocapsa sp.]|uniref:hypothetical protein n=1 Tax=uncultured Thiohalocapsa sp. TaxID=768990 RepID=UPI0025FBA4CD|nr:hypothetical protein [uncultured Thiohalocapsa sp.]